MEIPYTVEVRRDTGLTNGKIGIWLFLASEVMLFGALFASYILIRTGAEHWPRGASILNVPLATFNTLVLIGSSVTMVMAWASLVRQHTTTHHASLDHGGVDHAADIDKQVRIYVMVFVALMALTIITVAISYLHLPIHLAITLAVLVATIKGSLVACYFMHLISEKKLI